MSRDGGNQPRDIVFTTYNRAADLTPDDALVAAILRARGSPVVPAVWDDPLVEWARFACVVIRSAWDYQLKPLEYAQWLRDRSSDGSRVWNPPAAVLENLDKHYLAGLAAKGVESVTGVFLPAGGQASLADTLDRHGWDAAVVKPTVSASAYGTWRTARASAADDQPRFEQDLARHGLLLQPFVEEIVTHGEWSLIFFDGEFSHAVLKRPAAGDFRVQEELGGHATPAQPAAAIVEQARSILAHVDAPLLYARVDGVERKGRFVLMELEINEPFLYLSSCRAAAERFAAAIERAAGLGVAARSLSLAVGGLRVQNQSTDG